jgi:hypothetical protein
VAETAQERLEQQLQALPRFVLLQNTGNASNVVLFDTQRTAAATQQQQQRPSAAPLAVSDVRDMVFGVLPTTDAEATKLHILPGPQAPTLVLLSKLFACKPGADLGASSFSSARLPAVSSVPPVGSMPLNAAGSMPSLSRTASVAAAGSGGARATRRVVMALALIMQSCGDTQIAQRMRMFVAAHFLIVDMRMCKAVRRIREHVTALLSAQAQSTGEHHRQQQQRSSRSLSQIAGPFSNVSMRGMSLQDDDIVAHEIEAVLDSVASLLRGPRIERPLWPGIVQRASVLALGVG